MLEKNDVRGLTSCNSNTYDGAAETAVRCWMKQQSQANERDNQINGTEERAQKQPRE